MANRIATALRRMFLVLLLGSPSVTAAELPTATSARACGATAPATCRFAKGVLWKIERGGQKPSYLFGTIHVSDPRVTTLPTPVSDTLHQSSSFTMELITGGDGIVHMADAMFFNDERTLEGTIGAKRYAEVRRALTELGLPIGDLNKKKPWVVVLILAAPPQSDLPLDLQLARDATLQGKPTYGLESMEEQIDVFDKLSFADQAVLLDDTLAHYRESQPQLEAMVQAYLARDLIRLMKLMDSNGMENRRVHDTVMERLLAHRNERMVQRMRPRLEEGNAFIAVGAGHLAGERGLLPLLEQAGWRVSPVY